MCACERTRSEPRLTAMLPVDADDTSTIARPAVAAGILFFDGGGRVLVVEPSYKDGWDIPGGYVEPQESPRDAARREVQEELGIEVTPGALLAVDWAPTDDGDKLLFVFDGGEINPAGIPPIQPGHEELLSFEFFDMADICHRMPMRLVSRITAAIDNRADGSRTYVEHGTCPSEPKRMALGAHHAPQPAKASVVGHSIAGSPIAAPAL